MSDCALLVNTMVLPRLLYGTECILRHASQLLSIASLFERFVFSVMGLPSLVAKKTLYTHGSSAWVWGIFQSYDPIGFWTHCTAISDC